MPNPLSKSEKDSFMVNIEEEDIKFAQASILMDTD